MGADGIRVAVRFRPMNKVESQEDGNHICIKISACRRALRINNPERPDRPLKFYFDQIYPPGVAQIDVYKFTGYPLVESVGEGYNSTIFAYGQTGSGKTFSMMGVLGNEVLKGLVPRIIEDIFVWIEGVDDALGNEFTVQIIMCEIYMERVKDLFNAENDNLKVREDSTGGIYIEDITRTFCQSVTEVLDSMDQGFMNRATSATRMNAESSRSHCVVIIQVNVKASTGSVKVMKCKMIDLAGSEKTKKTEATGQRLEEAKTINQSLSALGNVMNALTEGGFIPYRNSKLTRILQDALGGNSKTSLIVAASPCSYNAEETISTLRFGERAKKVKNKPKINEELTLDEYKKKCNKLKAKVKILEMDNKLMKLQLEACMEWVNNNGGSFEDLIADIKVVEEREGSGPPPDVDFDSAEEISAQCFVIDKKTGKIVGGTEFSTTIGGTPKDDAKNAARAAEEEMEKRISGQMRSENDPNYGRTEGEGGGGGEFFQCNDEIDDLQAEIRGWKAQAMELEELVTEKDEIKFELEAQQVQLIQDMEEFKLYKLKVNWLEENNAIQIQRLEDMITHLKVAVGEEKLDFNQELDKMIAENPGEADMELIEELRVKGGVFTRKMGIVEHLKSVVRKANTGIDPNFMRTMAMGTEAEKREALQDLICQHKGFKKELNAELKKERGHKRQIQIQQKRDAYCDQMRHNWKNQLAQMEQAVVLCSQIHQRDRSEFNLELEARTDQVDKLNAYIKRINEARATRQKTAFGSVLRRLRKPISKAKKSKKGAKLWASLGNSKKKRRPSRRSGAKGGDDGGDDGGGKKMSAMDRMLALAKAKKAKAAQEAAES